MSGWDHSLKNWGYGHRSKLMQISLDHGDHR